MDGEEKQEKSALITIGDPPPAPIAWTFVVNDAEYEERGKVIEKEGNHFYVTGAVGAKAGVIIASDYWGYNSGRVRAIADHLADSVNAMVAIPKLLHEPPLRGGTDGDGMSQEIEDADADPVELKKWLFNYLWETFEIRMKCVATHLQQNGAQRLGGVGFGFGAWIMCYTSVLCKDMAGMVLVHPLAAFMEEMYGGDTYVMTSRVGCPALFMPTSTCPPTYKPGGEIYEAVKDRHDLTNYKPFLEMPHGWMTRGNIKQKGIKQGIEDAVMLMQKYLRHRIWPLPIGADADTLRKACQDGDADMVEELIKLQLPVGGEDALDVAGLSPIHYAARFGSVQPIRLLVEAQAEVNAQGGAMNESALHCAAMHGRNKAAATLLKLKADVDIQDKAEYTPLHQAAKKGHSGVIKVLISGQADIEAVDTAGQTALHLAAWGGDNNIVQYFISVKAEIETEDKRGQTPYMRAVQAGYTECSDTLDLERERRELEAFHKAAEEAAAAAAAAKAAGKTDAQPKARKSLIAMMSGALDDD